LNNVFVKKNQQYLNQNFRDIGWVLDVVGKSLMGGFIGCEFVIFRPEVGKTLNIFE
jgi:hypothetical protein